MERESKNSSDYTICPHVSDHQLKTACYKHSLVYIKPMITTNQKYTRDTQEIEEGIQTQCTEGHQNTREESNGVRNEQRITAKQSENN